MRLVGDKPGAKCVAVWSASIPASKAGRDTWGGWYSVEDVIDSVVGARRLARPGDRLGPANDELRSRL